MFAIHTIVLFIFSSHGFCLSIPGDPDVGIIGGHDISIGDVPYIVSLRLNGTIHYCGGSIIHERFILTAAHCILKNREYKVMVGTDKIHTGGTLYDVEKIIVNRKYENKTHDFDICLIKLKDPISFGPKVQKIALNENNIKLRKGMLLNATGWGYTQPTVKKISENLRQVQLPFIRPKTCRRDYGLMFVSITRRMLCAGGKGKDSCQGDSGGPLTYQGVQVGITSFGAGCAVLPGVYTNVYKMLPWITRKINQNI